MLIVDKNQLSNGAHRNQEGEFLETPDGWVLIPHNLEAEAIQFLPFISLTFNKKGCLTGVARNHEAWEAWQASQPDGASTMPTEEEDAASMLVDHEYRLTLLELGVI